MRALLFGAPPGIDQSPRNATPLRTALTSTPMDLVELDDPAFLRPDWVVIRPRLTGICGSDAKQVFMDWGDMSPDNPMIDFTSFPQRARPLARMRASRDLGAVPGVCCRRPFPVLELPRATHRRGDSQRHIV
jgi:hypothetical protein